jgi:hypothetical protein
LGILDTHAVAAHGVALPAGLAHFLAGPLNPAALGPLFSAFLLTFLQQGGKGILQLLKRGIDVRFKNIWSENHLRRSIQSKEVLLPLTEFHVVSEQVNVPLVLS